MTYRSGDDDSDSTKTYLGTTSPGSGGYSPKVYQPTAKTPKDPGRPSSLGTSKSRPAPASSRYSSLGNSGRFKAEGGLIQRRKKK